MKFQYLLILFILAATSCSTSNQPNPIPCQSPNLTGATGSGPQPGPCPVPSRVASPSPVASQNPSPNPSTQPSIPVSTLPTGIPGLTPSNNAFSQVKAWKGPVRINTDFQASVTSGSEVTVSKESFQLSGEALLRDEARNMTGASSGIWPTAPLSTAPVSGTDMLKAVSGWRARAVIRTESSNASTGYSQICTEDNMYDLIVYLKLEANNQYSVQFSNFEGGGPFKLKCTTISPGAPTESSEKMIGLNFDGTLASHVQALPASVMALTNTKSVNQPYSDGGIRHVTFDWSFSPVP